MTPAELDVMARTVWGEARGEGQAGMIAVAWVIANRANHPRTDWWGTSIIEVCKKPKQFSCWNPTDPNRKHLDAIGPHDKSYLRALIACCSVGIGDTVDPTAGATHYATKAKPSWAEEWPPGWTKSMTRTAEIGHHVFYREKET